MLLLLVHDDMITCTLCPVVKIDRKLSTEINLQLSSKLFKGMLVWGYIQIVWSFFMITIQKVWCGEVLLFCIDWAVLDRKKCFLLSSSNHSEPWHRQTISLWARQERYILTIYHTLRYHKTIQQQLKQMNISNYHQYHALD